MCLINKAGVVSKTKREGGKMCDIYKGVVSKTKREGVRRVKKIIFIKKSTGKCMFVYVCDIYFFGCRVLN